MGCDHCAAVRQRQAQIGHGGVLTAEMPYPKKYFTGADEAGLYDRLDASCSCRCHDVWRLWRRLTGA